MLTSLALIFLVGLCLGSLFQKLKLPSLVGMILTGVLLGPSIFNCLSPSLLGIAADLRQLALVIILTRAGLSLNLADLKAVGRSAILMCFLPACFEIAAIMLIAPYLLGVTLLEAAIIGSVVAAVSPAVIVPRMLKLMDEKRGTKQKIPQLIMAGASVDDIFVIVLFTAFVALAQGESVSFMSVVSIPFAILLGFVVGYLVGLILNAFFVSIHLRDSVKVLIILSISFLLIQLETSIASFCPFSGLLAIMSMGIAILKKNECLASRIAHKYSKLWVGAELLLFVLVGVSIDVQFALQAGLAVIVLILVALVFRMMGVACCLIQTPLNKQERLFCMIAYSPKATVQAAIGSIPYTLGLPCGLLVLTIAVLSILISAPLGAFGIDMTYKRFLQQDSIE